MATPSPSPAATAAGSSRGHAYTGVGVVLEQAARGVELLSLMPGVSADKRGRLQSKYFEYLAAAIGRLFECWDARAHILAGAWERPRGAPCALCGLAPYDTKNVCPECGKRAESGEDAGTMYPRVVWLAATYIHRLLIAGMSISSRRLNTTVATCLLLALKAQMPTDISWGMTLLIQLVAGPACTGEDALQLREAIIRTEHRVLQVVGPKSLRTPLPMDCLRGALRRLCGDDDDLDAAHRSDTALTLLAASAADPAAVATAAASIAKAERLQTIRAHALRLCGDAYRTPLIATCGPEEIAAAAVWFAWRMTCTADEIAACEDTVLQRLGVADSIAASLAPKDASLASLLAFGIVEHADALFAPGVEAMSPVDDGKSASASPPLGSQSTTPGGSSPVPLSAGPTISPTEPQIFFATLRKDTRDAPHGFVTAKGGLQVRSLAEALRSHPALAGHFEADGILAHQRHLPANEVEAELMDFVCVQRGGLHYPLSSLVGGWARTKRAAALQPWADLLARGGASDRADTSRDDAADKCAGGAAPEMALNDVPAAFECLFWWVWRWVATECYVHLEGFQPGVVSAGSAALADVVDVLMGSAVVDPCAWTDPARLGGVVAVLPPSTHLRRAALPGGGHCRVVAPQGTTLHDSPHPAAPALAHLPKGCVMVITGRRGPAHWLSVDAVVPAPQAAGKATTMSGWIPHIVHPQLTTVVLGDHASPLMPQAPSGAPVPNPPTSKPERDPRTPTSRSRNARTPPDPRDRQA